MQNNRKYTKPLESAVRKKIDIILKNLGWNTDEFSPECNVYTERPRTTLEMDKLNGMSPDYVLYDSKTNIPIVIVEAKKEGESIDSAIEKAKEYYAKPLDVKLVFVYDGAFFKSWHIKEEKELTIDGEPVIQFLSENKIKRFLVEGANIIEETPKIKHTRAELINIFKWANDLLRKEGLREGIERFTEFANVLFLKLISEIEEDKERNGLGQRRLLEDKYCWKSFADLDPDRMLAYVNKIILPYLRDEYNKTGDVFENSLRIKNPSTLFQIVRKLSELELINSDSDVKGDAFEYFLKNSVTVGNDLGEYFTPRHLVRMMVNLINPKFGDKIYDPTCGTGGFIIEAFKHIYSSCSINPHTLEVLREETIYARELTDTAKIAKMNMIIAGDGHTNIKQMDALEDKQEEQYDIVLANIPYGQTTDYGNLYPIYSRQADCVFVQHILLSLKKTGKAAIIVPEGFLFRGGADKKVRKYMLDNYSLISVVSLPNGVFLPYTDSKTDIIFLEAGKRTKSVWFYDLKHDGFENGDKKRPIKQNDIPNLLSKWSDKELSENSWFGDIETIKINNYDLLPKTYKPDRQPTRNTSISHGVRILNFNDIMKEAKEYEKISPDIEYQRMTVQWYGKGIVPRDMVMGRSLKVKEQKIAHMDQFVVAEIDAKNGSFGVVPKELDGSIVSSHYFLFDIDKGRALPKFLDYVVRYGPYERMIQSKVKGTTNYAAIRPRDFLQMKVPLPPLEYQEELVRRIDKQTDLLKNLQSTYDSFARGFIDEAIFNVGNHTLKTIEELITRKPQYGITQGTMPDSEGTPFIRITDLDSFGRVNYGTLPKIPASKFEISKYRVESGDLIVARSGSIGKCAVVESPVVDCLFASYLIRFSFNKETVNPKFVLFYLLSSKGQHELASRANKTAQVNINARQISSIKIPIPQSLQDQAKVVAKVEEKLTLVDSIWRTISETEQTIRSILDQLYYF